MPKQNPMTNNYVYILLLRDETYYIGYTNHLPKRIAAHNSGKGAKRTKGRGPVKLMYYEIYPTKSQALKREYALKQLSQKQKRMLIENQPLTILNDECRTPPI